MGKKSTPLPLTKLWDFEDESTAFVGSPTGGKIGQPDKSAPAKAVKVFSGRPGAAETFPMEELPISKRLKKGSLAGATGAMQKAQAIQISTAKRPKAKV